MAQIENNEDKSIYIKELNNIDKALAELEKQKESLLIKKSELINYLYDTKNQNYGASK